MYGHLVQITLRESTVALRKTSQKERTEEDEAVHRSSGKDLMLADMKTTRSETGPGEHVRASYVLHLASEK